MTAPSRHGSTRLLTSSATRSVLAVQAFDTRWPLKPRDAVMYHKHLRSDKSSHIKRRSFRSLQASQCSHYRSHCQLHVHGISQLKYNIIHFHYGKVKGSTLSMPCSRAFQFAIRIDSIRFVMRIDSNRFVLWKKSAFRFTSCHTVFALNK